MTPVGQLAALAAARHGVISRADAMTAGFSSDQLKRLVAGGHLEHVAYRTYVFTSSPPTWLQAVAIATTTSGGLASHRTAAYLHGLTDRRPPSIEVVMNRWNRARQEFTVHESLDLIPADNAEVAGIATTSPVRTVVDLGASAPYLVEDALDTGLRLKVFTLEDVSRFVGRVARRGRRGVGVIRPFVEQRILWSGLTESLLEDLFRRMWGTREPEPIPQHVIRKLDGTFVCRADFAYTEERLRIELDSVAFHTDTPTFHRDRRQQNQTEMLGWTTLRYTWWDLTSRPESVVSEIQAVLDRGKTSRALHVPASDTGA